MFQILIEVVGMPRDHTLTEFQNTLTPRKKPWTGVVTWPRRKGWNSFLMAQMVKFKIPTAMVQTRIHPRIPNINHRNLLR